MTSSGSVRMMEAVSRQPGQGSSFGDHETTDESGNIPMVRDRSGTNDKAGSMWNLIRWVSPRTIKETFAPPSDYQYPSMRAE